MSVATLANLAVTVERATVTKDAMGGQIKTWAPVLRTKCRLQPLSASESIRHSKDESVVTHKAYFPGTPNIQPGDRIPITAKPIATETDYLYVTGVRNINYLDQFLTVELEKRDQSG